MQCQTLPPPLAHLFAPFPKSDHVKQTMSSLDLGVYLSFIMNQCFLTTIAVILL